MADPRFRAAIVAAAVAAASASGGCAVFFTPKPACAPVVSSAEIYGPVQRGDRLIKVNLTRSHRCGAGSPGDLVLTRDGVEVARQPFHELDSALAIADVPVTEPGRYVVALDVAGRHDRWTATLTSVPYFGGHRELELHLDGGVHLDDGLRVARWRHDTERDPAWRVEWYQGGALVHEAHGRSASPLHHWLGGIRPHGGAAAMTWWHFDEERYEAWLPADLTRPVEVRIYRDDAPPIAARIDHRPRFGEDLPAVELPAAAAAAAMARLAAEPPVKRAAWDPPLCPVAPDELRAVERSAAALAAREAVNDEPFTRRDDFVDFNDDRVEHGGVLESHAEWDARVAAQHRRSSAAADREQAAAKGRTRAMCARMRATIRAAQGDEPTPSLTAP